VVNFMQFIYTIPLLPKTGGLIKDAAEEGDNDTNNKEGKISFAGRG